MQRTGPVSDTVPGEMEEEPGPATPHSAHNLQAPQAHLNADHLNKTSVRPNPNRREEKITQLRREGSETQRIADPFGFIKKLLGQRHSGHLSCLEEEVNHFISATYSDSMSRN